MREYYRGLATFGIICELSVALGLTGISTLHDLRWTPFLIGFILSLFTGIIATFIFAEFVSQQPHSTRTFSRVIFNPLLIFTCGIFSGVIVNFLYQGLLLNSDQNFMSNFHIWFVKPFYWLMLIGAPASLVVGMVYFPLNIASQKFNKIN